MKTKTLKTKTVLIAVTIPVKYKWIAQHQWGEWTAFVRKPEIIYDHSGVPCWKIQYGELSLCEGRGLEINDQWEATRYKI